MAVLGLFRPLAVALSLFIALNAGASAASPALGAGRLIVNLPLPEPELSLCLVLFALCLLFPARRRALRAFQLWVLAAFSVAVAANIVRYYALIAEGLIATPLPVPFSALVLAITLAEWLGLFLAREPKRPPAAVGLLLLPAAFLLLVAAHIVTFGHTDYRGIGAADAAIVLGARVDADGSVSESLHYRLMTGVELFEEGRVKALIMTGGTGASGVNEAEAMARFAESLGVPEGAILCDGLGTTTFASAVNCAAIYRRFGLERVMVVSQYYHLARVKLIFERQGMRVLTVPARVGGQIRKNLYYLLRETVALPYYYLCCTFGGNRGA